MRGARRPFSHSAVSAWLRLGIKSVSRPATRDGGFPTLERVRISVLGPLTVEGGSGTLSPRDRIVLKVLTLHSREVVVPAQLAEFLGP